MVSSTTLSPQNEMDPELSTDSLLWALKLAMHERGLTILGLVAVDAEGRMTAIGDPRTTQSAKFVELLRCLADQIDIQIGLSPEWWSAAQRPEYKQ